MGYIDNILKKWFKDEDNFIMNSANFSAVLYKNINDLNWVGFYMVSGEEFILSTFQGKAAYRRIKLGYGVVGTAALNQETLVIDNVNDYIGHIVCDPDSLSELAVPLFKNGKLYGVLDVDSSIHNKFDNELKNDIESYLKILIDSSDLEAVWDYYNK